MGMQGERLVIETVDLGREAQGEFWLWLPNNPKLATCNGEGVVIEDKVEGIYSLKLHFIGRGRIEVLI
jgi:hypothetical protein